MGTPIAGKSHTTPLVGTEKLPLSPDGYATTQEVADLGPTVAADSILGNNTGSPAPAASLSIADTLSLLGITPNWVEHDIPGVIAGNWLSTSGTWSDAAGVISQTDATADSILESVAPFPSTEFVVQADVRILSGQDAGTAAVALISAGDANVVASGSGDTTGFALGEGAQLASSAVGDAQPIVISALIDSSPIPPVATGFATAVAQDQWHTLRAFVSPTRQVVYLDSVYVFASESISGGNTAGAGTTPPTTTDRVHLGAVGLADFRNISVWTLGLP